MKRKPDNERKRLEENAVVLACAYADLNGSRAFGADKSPEFLRAEKMAQAAAQLAYYQPGRDFYEIERMGNGCLAMHPISEKSAADYMAEFARAALSLGESKHMNTEAAFYVGREWLCKAIGAIEQALKATDPTTTKRPDRKRSPAPTDSGAG